MSKYVQKLLMAALTSVVMFTIVGVFYLVIKSVQADGKMIYCYVEQSTTSLMPIYKLYGYRSWRSDRLIGYFANTKEAVEFANSIQCSMDK